MEFSGRLAVTVIVSLLVVFVIGVVMVSVEFTVATVVLLSVNVELSTIVVELSGVV